MTKNIKYKCGELTACCSDCQYGIRGCGDACEYRWENCPFKEKCLDCRGYIEKLEVKIEKKKERKKRKLKSKNKVKQREEVI